MTHEEIGMKLHRELKFSLPVGARDYVQKLRDELSLLDIILDTKELSEEIIKSNALHILLKFWNTKEWQSYVVQERRHREILSISQRCEESSALPKTAV